MCVSCSRRRVLAALASAAGLGLLSACGGSAPGGAASASAPTKATGTPVAAGPAQAGAAPTAPASSGQVTIRLALWQTGVSAQLFDKVYNRFEQLNPTIKIQKEVTAFAQFFQRLEVGFAGGSAPDCFHSSGNYVVQFAQKGALLDLGPSISAGKVDFNGIWVEEDEMKVQGKWYAMPTWNTDDVLYYNKSAFQKAGVAEPTDDWTWNDMLAAAQKLTTRNADGKVEVWGIQIPNNNQGGWGAMIYANGGDWMNAAQTKTTMDQPPAMEAMQFIYDLMQKYKVMPTAVDNQTLTQAGVTDPFTAGKLAMYTAITSNVPTYLANAKFEWDMALIPKGPRTNKNGSTYIVQPSSITRTTKYPDQCFQLLAWTMNTEAQRILATDKVKFPVNIAAAKDAHGGFSTPPPAHIARAVETMGFAKPFHFFASGAEYLTKVEDQLAKAYLGQTTMEQAVKLAVAAGDQVLAQG